MTTRYERLVESNPKLVKTERQKKLPVWAQILLNNYRELLLREAYETDLLREEIERSPKPLPKDSVVLDRDEWGAIIEALGERESLLQEKIPPGGSWDSNDHRSPELRRAYDKFTDALEIILDRAENGPRD